LLLKRLGLRNYRNYERLDLEPAPGLNVFLGSNGQGKTNLLESIALLALSSSPRARREAELVGPVTPACRVEATVESGGRQREIQVDVTVEAERSRRQILIDGVKRRAVELPGVIKVALFWPDDLGLVKGGPELRRRFLNQLLVQVEPGYAGALSSYTRVVEQRNHLLKRIWAGDEPADTLDAWDAELVRHGGLLVAAREQAVAELAPLAADYHALISGGEAFGLRYLGPDGDLYTAVQNSRTDDLRRGSTSVGPHRDDLEIRIGERDARAFGSQGQQRTAVVSLKQAEAALIRRRSGEAPILLLDDVLSELDATRRAALFEAMDGAGQVVITSVDAESFPARMIAGASVHCIEAGSVRSCG
jgi:DNA replication and repair protein RecF